MNEEPVSKNVEERRERPPAVTTAIAGTTDVAKRDRARSHHPVGEVHRVRLADVPLAVAVFAIWLLHRLWLILPPRAGSRPATASTRASHFRSAAGGRIDGRPVPTTAPPARTDEPFEVETRTTPMSASGAVASRNGSGIDVADDEREHVERRVATTVDID